MQTLKLDQEFFAAFGRDVDVHGQPLEEYYLDKETSEVHWISPDDLDFPEEMEEMRQQIKASPHRFLKIPGLSHGDHHGILLDFLDSEEFRAEIGDENAQNEAKAEYLALQSIGGWLETVDEAVDHAYRNFENQRIEEMAKEFLGENGIEVG